LASGGKTTMMSERPASRTLASVRSSTDWPSINAASFTAPVPGIRARPSTEAANRWPRPAAGTTAIAAMRRSGALGARRVLPVSDLALRHPGDRGVETPGAGVVRPGVGHPLDVVALIGGAEAPESGERLGVFPQGGGEVDGRRERWPPGPVLARHRCALI